MKKLEDTLRSMFNPGTLAGKFSFGLLFFLFGLLLVSLGFWKTLLIAGLTLVGVFIGSAETIGKATAKLIDRIYPPKNGKVVYTPEDLEKVKKASELKKGTKPMAEEPEQTREEKETGS